MALESGTYINSLNASNPVATDGLAQADDHLRLLKSTILASLPGITGAVNATHTELNIIDGDTAATSTTLVDADRLVVNDDGTMVQVAMTDLITYIDANNTLRDDVVTTSSIADDAVGTANIADGAVTAAKLAVGAAFVSGMVMSYAGTSAPTGWQFCYGQALNTFTYKDLHAAISNTYGGTAYTAGVTDQSGATTTFNVPDLRGRVVAGRDNMGGTSANKLTNFSGGLNGDVLGATGGSEKHQLLETQMPSHTHNITGTYRKDFGSPPGGSFPHGSSHGTSGVNISGFLSLTNSSTGGNQSHNNVQPTIILNYIIKT